MSDASEFFEWLDGQDDPAERETPGWMCDTIDKAEGAARRLREATDRIAEIDAVANRMIADAEAWRSQASSPWASQCAASTADIETFLRVQIDAGGPKSSPLPYGVSVSARKTGGTLDLSMLDAESAPAAIVKMKPAIVAAEAGKYYRIIGPDGVEVDGKDVKVEAGVEYTVVDPNGEVVDSVSVKPVVDAVTVRA